MKRSHLILLAVILAAALLLRLVPAVRCDARPDFSDMERYNEAALGHELEEPLPPGYPLFLRGIYGVFGARNYRAVFVLQALLSAFTVLVIFHVTRRLGGVAPALAAAATAAVYPNFIVYNLTTMTETVSVLIVCLLLALLVADIPDRAKAILAAVVLFAGYLFKPAFLFFGPGLFLGMRRRFTLAVAMIALLVPWLLLTGSDKGYHRGARALYKSYHPESNGRSYVDIWETELDDRDTPTGDYAARAWSYIAGDPWRVTETIYNKATIVFSRGWDSFVVRPIVGERRSAYYALVYGYIPVMLLGLAGMARLAGGRNRILVFMTASYLVLIILIAIFKVRYRLLVEPMMIVFAALMAVWLVRRLRRRESASPPPAGEGFFSIFRGDLDILAVIFLAAVALRVYLAVAFAPPPASAAAVAFERVATQPGPSSVPLPVYPLFLRLVYAIFGVGNHAAACAAQGISGSLAVPLLYGIASRLFSRKAGLIAAALAAVYPGFIIAGLKIRPDIFVILAVLCLMAVPLLRLSEARRAALAGAIAAIALLLHPLLLLAAPGAFIAARRKRLFALVFMLALAPVVAVNAVRLHRTDPVYHPAMYEIGAGIVTGADDGWEVLDHVYNNANVLVRKPWNAADEKSEHDGNRGSTFAAGYMFTVIMALGITGFVRRWRRVHLRPLLPVLSYTALVILLLTFVRSGDRLPLVPAFIIYAAGFLSSPRSAGESDVTERLPAGSGQPGVTTA